MRLWSIHPEYLDRTGLVAAWREGLLARKVLKGLTRGYRNHPQLERFKDSKKTIAAIDSFLFFIAEEAGRRGYSFNKDKISGKHEKSIIRITDGQLEYEFSHLKNKLKERDKEKFKELKKVKTIRPNPIFRKVKGEVESWERKK